MSNCIKDLYDYNLVKKCLKCGNISLKSNFHKDKNRENDFQLHCICCRTQYYNENRDRLLNKQNFYDKENCDKVKEYKKKYYLDNHNQINENYKNYNKQNREKIRLYEKNRKKNRFKL